MSVSVSTIYVGYDSRFPLAYEACERSIKKFAPNVVVKALKKDELQANNLYQREDENESSTEFTYLRFLVPYLEGYHGHAIYCDSTMMWRADPREMTKHINSHQAAAVVQHNFTSCPSDTKLGDLPQVYYPRKNWASVILFNCSHPDSRRLIPKEVRDQTAKYLLEFDWIEKPSNLGLIPLEYNYLLGYYSSPVSDSDIKAVNYTDGGPWDVNYRHLDFADEWDSYLTWAELSEIV